MAAVALMLAGCRAVEDRGVEPEVPAAEAVLLRLTRASYLDSLVDLFGPELVLPTALEPDLEVEGLYAVGAGQAALSPLGVEQYETAAYLVAEQVMGDEELRARIVPCEPADAGEEACAEAFVRTFGRLAWRRPLTEAEVEGLVALAGAASEVVGDFYGGLEYALAALLQSPHFLYRVELGEGGRLTSIEAASRLSFLLWDGPPDEELLALGEEGALDDPDVRRTQAERMWEDPRARRGLRAFFDDWLDLVDVADVVKDPVLFVHWSEGIGASAREETLSTLEWLVFDVEGDLRDLATTRTTFLDRSLAALYAVPAPAREGFARTELPADGPRAGLLGQASFLALQAHSTSTSVTRRGMFVRTALLCQEIPPPPANVDTSIPAPTEEAPTMRERVAQHLSDPGCAACHQVTDPIGLGFEQFDGIGRYRTEEGGASIQPFGDLDGVVFGDAVGLGRALRDHPDLPLCVVEQLLGWSSGRPVGEGQEPLVDWYSAEFVAGGAGLRELVIDVVASEAFLAVERP
jgi:hypothetical protein